MINPLNKETCGAWIIHHGRKVALDTNGAAEFPALDEAAKCATLLAKLGETGQAIVTLDEAKAVAKTSGINPRHELNGLLAELEKKRLIQQGSGSVELLGVTQRGALAHAADFFEDAQPSKFERGSIILGELSSQAPVSRRTAKEYVGDTCELSSKDATDFLEKAEALTFVDGEGQGEDGLIFNGHLFRKDHARKAAAVLASLTEVEQRLVNEADALLKSRGCMTYSQLNHVLGETLFEKLQAAGVYDLSLVINEKGDHGFITSPAAFHKFVDPLVDDSFDLAKSLVAALSYGMHQRSASQGRITMLEALLRKLINGYEVGPATAIAHDYRALETSRVVKLRADGRYQSRFWMRLLKREVGELALQVLLTGDATKESLNIMPNAPMSGYEAPEVSRRRTRRSQTPLSKRGTLDVLDAVRSGGGI